MSVDIVFDIGATKMRVGAVRGGALTDIHIVNTPREPKEGMRTLLSLAREASHGENITSFVGCAAGLVHHGVLLKAPNIPLWDGLHLAEYIEKETGAPLALFNDAALVGLGEYVHGAGKGSRVMAYVTVSTGVGGARIVDGAIDSGEYTFEIGHQLVRGKDLESQISGSAVQKKYGVAPHEFANNPALCEMAEILAEGLHNMTVAWSPDTIVLGGSMIAGEKNTIPFAHINDHLQTLVTTIYPHTPRLRKAMLSKLGGLYGGLAYLERDASKKLFVL